MERVYLGDWLYNAGIVGFLKINSHLWYFDNNELVSKDEALLKIGDNYIEFNRKIFEGFAEKFFEALFKQYIDYKNINERLQNLLERIEKLSNAGEKNNEKHLREIKREMRRILKYLKLEKEIPIPKSSTNEDISEINERILEIRNKFNNLSLYDKEEIVRTKWLKKGKKGFYFHENFKSIFSIEDFKKKIEEPLVKNINENFTKGRGRKKLDFYCLSCYPLRKAKKGKFFSTSISTFAGLNEDTNNFLFYSEYNKPDGKIKIPLCDICHIIYLLFPIGTAALEKNSRRILYFVNSDTSVEELLRDNLLLERFLNRNLKENSFINFFTEILLMAETKKAEYTLQNVAVVELDLNNETMPKIYSFNLSKEKARFFKDNKENLKKLSKLYYEIKKDRFSVLPEVVGRILNSGLNYSYVARLTKIYLNKEKQNYATNMEAKHLQILNILTIKFLTTIVLGGKIVNVEEKELWYIYKKGEELARKLKNSNAENKIQSIAYRLLNALRVGNVNQFMDVLIRTYMAYGEKIPSSFVKTISNQRNFYPIGYSFLNGLLGKEKGEVDQNG